MMKFGEVRKGFNIIVIFTIKLFLTHTKKDEFLDKNTRQDLGISS